MVEGDPVAFPEAARRAAPRTTVPAISWPKMRGPGSRPFWIFLMSVPQMPQASTRTSISAGPTSGTGTSSTRRSPAPLHTAAIMDKARWYRIQPLNL